MNKYTVALLFLILPSLGWAKSWTNGEVDQIFSLLFEGGANAASEEVEAYGVSSFDFGMDLLFMNENQKALTWFSVQSQVDSDPNFLFGKAWLEMEMENLLVAMQTANSLLGRTQGLLAEARAHYLLGVIHQKGGSHTYARNELNIAAQLYREMDKEGGVRLCQRLLDPQKSSTIIVGADPPRDDDDS